MRYKNVQIKTLLIYTANIYLIKGSPLTVAGKNIVYSLH
jgi:hypothetical protein